MARTIEPDRIRRYDLEADPLPDDDWGAKATLALPTDVPIWRMVGAGPLRIVCETTTTETGGTVVTDDVDTGFTLGVVVFRLVDGAYTATQLEQVTCTDGDLLGVELVEADLDPGDAFAIAVTGLSVGASSGAWLRVYPTSEVSRHPEIVGES
jgi:hypothetical protein